MSTSTPAEGAYTVSVCLGKVKAAYVKGSAAWVLILGIMIPLPGALCRTLEVVSWGSLERGILEALEGALRVRSAARRGRL